MECSLFVYIADSLCFNILYLDGQQHSSQSQIKFNKILLEKQTVDWCQKYVKKKQTADWAFGQDQVNDS